MSGSLRRTFSIRQRFTHQLHDDEATEAEVQIQRERVLEAIDLLYATVDSIPKPVLDGEDMIHLKLKVEHLATDEGDGGSLRRMFFDPLLDEAMQRFPMAEHEPTQSRLEIHNTTMDIRPPDYRPISTASALCGNLAWQFSTAHRDNVPEDKEGLHSPNLAWLSRWRYQEGFSKCMFKARYANTVFLERNPKFQPIFSWESYDRQDKPHLMFCMKHDVRGEERLLRGEVLAILAAMRSRMSFQLFKKHLIIPIMIFSFLGQYGRIIQAYHDGQNLVLYKTQLFPFFDSQTAPMDLFVRYLANHPVGNTSQLAPQPRRGQISQAHFQPPPSAAPGPSMGPDRKLRNRRSGMDWFKDHLGLHRESDERLEMKAPPGVVPEKK